MDANFLHNVQRCNEFHCMVLSVAVGPEKATRMTCDVMLYIKHDKDAKLCNVQQCRCLLMDWLKMLG